MEKKEIKFHILNMYTIALSDGDFDQTEMEVIVDIAKEKGVSEEDLKHIALDPTFVMMEFTSYDTREKIKSLFDFAKVIWADGKVEETERLILCNFCKKFGFEEDEIAIDLTEWLIELAKEKPSQSESDRKINDLLNNVS